VGGDSNEHVLVDASDFLLRDFHGAAGALRPGPYRVDRTRSAIYMPNTKAFPKNTEIDVLLTFASDGRAAAAAAEAGPLRDHRRSAKAPRRADEAGAEAAASAAASSRVLSRA